MIIIKTPAEIDRIGESGAILADCLRMLRKHSIAGAKTGDLDRRAEAFIMRKGARPAFKGYKGYPASVCTSVNDVIVHGIPDDYVLKDGDIISLDVGVEKGGYIADAAITVPIGKVQPRVRELMEATEQSLYDGIDKCRAGNRVGDISHAVQKTAEAAGFSVVRSLVGHGVGKKVHEEPQIPNFGPPNRGPLLKEGMVIAIEPMINAGGHRIASDNGWPIRTADSSYSAHFEHTVAVTKNGPQILTLSSRN